jgi:hypothetical protein
MGDKVSGLVLICGIIPWRRMSISSLGCLGGGIYSPFPYALPLGVAGETQLAYVQRYSQYSSDGKCISFSMLYYVDILFRCLID